MDCYYNFYNLEHYLSERGIKYSASYLRWVKDIINTAVTMFTYPNAGKYGLTSEIIEKSLMFNNFLCGYKDSSVGFVICRWRSNSVYDLYFKPKTVNLLSISGKTIKKNVPYSDIVLLRDNPMDIIPFITLNDWIDKIMDKEKTLESVFDWISLPVILTGSKQQVTELKQIIKKSKIRDPFAVADVGFSKNLEMYDIKLPATITDIYDTVKRYRAMAVQSIGIYQSDEKRERMIAGEVEAANDYVDFIYNGKCQERKRFVEECREKFDVDLGFNESYVTNLLDNIAADKKRALANDAGKIKIAKIEAQSALQVAQEGDNNVVS